MEDQLTVALANLEESNVLAQVNERLKAGHDPLAILKACQEGMIRVGKRYETCEYFISDLMMAGEIFRQVADLLTPKIKRSDAPSRGKVVIGTAKGDIHDIGKNLVVALLKAANYEVYDLGVDVPPERFVEVLKESGAPVLGLSALLTIAFDTMKQTVAALDTAGIRKQVKVMIGGGPTTEETVAYTGADAMGRDAQSAVTLCNQWIRASV